jgi:hypothetical protein
MSELTFDPLPPEAFLFVFLLGLALNLAAQVL